MSDTTVAYIAIAISVVTILWNLWNWRDINRTARKIEERYK